MLTEGSRGANYENHFSNQWNEIFSTFCHSLLHFHVCCCCSIMLCLWFWILLMLNCHFHIFATKQTWRNERQTTINHRQSLERSLICLNFHSFYFIFPSSCSFSDCFQLYFAVLFNSLHSPSMAATCPIFSPRSFIVCRYCRCSTTYYWLQAVQAVNSSRF